MTASEFIAGKSDDELVEFLKVGRPPDDPLNTTGVAMLPKGGNPSLTDEDLHNIVAYIRTLQQ
jgi:disulfide bond formation protein DsbB